MALSPTRREFIHRLGLSAAALPFLGNLEAFAAPGAKRKQRLVVIFSPDGIVPKSFWPDAPGPLASFKESLTPLEPFRKQTMILRGVCDKIRGDGDGHMRGIGCLLTGIELFPGNIQGGSDTPAGWSSGISIDQELRNFYQKNPATRTRFGSLELGVMVPERADTWTRMSYAGANQPVSPIDDPYQTFNKLYGRTKDRVLLASVLDDLQEELKAVRAGVGAEDRKILDEHATLVREVEKELQAASKQDAGHAMPPLAPGIRRDNDNMPQLSKLQIDLLVRGFAADASRIATLQYTNSVGQAKMRWLGVEEGQHDLSHEPNSNVAAQEKLTKINKWYCEQVAYLAKKLSETPEPGGGGSLLDNTTIVWTNELGQGNSHTLDNIPFVLVGGGAGLTMGRALDFKSVPHNRLLISLLQSYGHNVKTFGNPNYCGDGPLTGLAP